MKDGMADSRHCRHRCAQLQCQQTAILFAPSPGGEIIRQSCVGGMRLSVPPNPRHNIIYRDCVTSFGAPSPNLFSRCTQYRLCSNLLCINKFSRCVSNPPCRVGRQHWVRSACRSTLHNASPRTTCPASWAAACGQSGSRNLRR